MRGRTITLTVVAFFIGAMAAAGIGVRVIDEVRTSEDATSLPPENILSTTTTFAALIYVAADETRIGSTVLVPLEIRQVNRMLAIEYYLFSIAPNALPGQTVSENRGPAPAAMFPSSWVLNTTSGQVRGGPSSPSVTIARFDLPIGVGVADITSVEIANVLVAYPFEAAFELSLENPSVVIADGIVVVLADVRMAESADAVSVSVNLVIENPLNESIVIEGSGSGWLPSASTNRRRPGTVLRWVGAPVPSVFTFVATGVRWIEIEGSFPVSIENLK